MEIRVLDPDTERLRTLLQAKTIRRGELEASELLLPIWASTLRSSGVHSTVTLEAEVASRLLSSSIEGTTDFLREWAQHYSSARWLWMLRRLPAHVFAGELSTTAPYDAYLSEVLSGTSQRADRSSTDAWSGYVRYPVEGTVARNVSRFVAGTRRLSQLHVAYRWAGKGSPITLAPDSWPTATPATSLRMAVETFDRRMATGLSGLTRIGFRAGRGITPSTKGGLTFPWVERIEPTEASVTVPGIRLRDVTAKTALASVEARFSLSLIDLGEFAKVLSDPRVARQARLVPEIGALIYLLAGAGHFITSHRGGSSGLLSTGYLTWVEKPLLSDLEAILAYLPKEVSDVVGAAGLKTGLDVVHCLDAIQGRPWPLLPGPVLRRGAGVILMDFASACARLASELSTQRLDDSAANARAETFENQVQTAIDESAWRPGQHCRALQRRTLRIAGHPVTDIDAVGEKSGTLLLVSCKSTVCSGSFDVGDFRTVRNVRTTVEAAVKRWQEVLAVLRTSPVGDNFDFSEFRRITGVVCTPTVPFVVAQEALAEVEGLTAAVSLGELEAWLAS
jgi:hypothetical protein